MTATEKTKELLAKRTEEAKMTASPVQAISKLITGDYMKKQLEMSLPVNLKKNAEKYMRCYLTQVRTTPRLAACNVESVLGSMMTGAALGLEPAPSLGHFYMLPFKDECTFVLGYKGMLELAQRAGIRRVTAHEVYSNDVFEIEFGANERLVHKPNFSAEDRGQIIGYYATVLLPSGDTQFHYMTKQEMVVHKNRYALSKSRGPWEDNFNEMALKTVIRKLFKFIPKATEFSYALTKDEGVIKVTATDTITKPQDVLDLPTEYMETPQKIVVCDTEKEE